MNKDINHTLMALVPLLNMNGEKVDSIEAVRDWYKAEGGEYCKEVAEITCHNGYRIYADIGCDSNLAAVYDVVAVMLDIKSQSARIERIERGVYEKPESVDGQPKTGGWIPCSERLPEIGDTILAFIRHNYRDDGWRAYRVYEFNGRFVGMGNLCEVIAWQPLPEPYREEG